MNIERSEKEWWRGACIYEVYLRSFQDSNDDGEGDLRGLLNRLPYLADLGIDAIWITPFFPSPMFDSGYAVSDYQRVDPRFGSLDDFDAIIATAHALGLKVIIDQVYSHTSHLHPWFIESQSAPDSKHADWYVWADAKLDGSCKHRCGRLAVAKARMRKPEEMPALALVRVGVERQREYRAEVFPSLVTDHLVELVAVSHRPRRHDG